jgi:nucleotide-binding universal stress UspA family protein
MAFGTIMVNVDFDEDSQDRIHIAAGIANRFGSFLIGVAGWALRGPDDPRLAGMDYRTENAQKKILERLDQLKATFQQIAGETPCGIEWRSSTNIPNEFMSAQARAADLLVIGQRLSPGDELHTYDPGTVILAAGRPVLVIPRGMRQFQSSNVLIAWKDNREARRAVRDALPFLKQAQSVCVAMANPGDSQRAATQMSDLVQYLEHHDISVSQQIATGADENEGNVLGELARKHDSNLIVAGAYGRTRLSEWIFGGVTRHLLLTSPVPCLFSN